MQRMSMRGSDIAEDGAIPSERVLPLVYDELRRLAASRMLGEAQGHTLQPTALVHEAWLRLENGTGHTWQNKAHFFAAAARAMRRILVDRARQKSALKRQVGEPFPDPSADGLPQRDDHLLLIHESLARLEAEDPEAAEIVLLKFFSGLGSKEIAAMTGCSMRSIERSWTLAKARLYQMIREEL
jgi:RNA polymerase sigma factor (TIGR02999 family)